MIRSVLLALFLSLSSIHQASATSSTVHSRSLDAPFDEVYAALYSALEEGRFYVVFEPDIGSNLARFEKRWGEDYNRNGLSELRSMVFCNAWYANAVANADPDMTGLCPLHISLYQRQGQTTILFNRPSVIAAQSPALPVIEEIEATIIAIIASVKVGQ